MFNDFLDALGDDTFDEIPVDLKTFIEDEHYMGLPPMSAEQMKVLEAMTQIYYPETLDALYEDDPAYRDYLKSLRIKELIAMIGKGCVVGDSLVFTDKGWQQARDVPRGRLQTKAGMQQASDAMLSGVESTLTIKTHHGYELTAHKEHKVRTDKGWRTVKNLEVGERVELYMGGYDTPGLEFSNDEARWLGYLFGDGSFPSSKPRSRAPRLTNVTPEVYEDWIEITESKSGIVVKRELSGYGASRFVASGSAGRGSNYWIDFCRRYGLEDTKHWNNELLNMSKEQTAHFMVGLIATDGYIYPHGGVEIALSDESIMRGVQQLLMNIGVMARLTEKVLDDPKHKNSWRLYIPKEYSSAIWNTAGILCPGKDENCYTEGSTTSVAYTVVTEIVESGEQEIYDFIVSPDRHYVANGFVNHNGGKNHTTITAVCRIVYLLLCLKDPAAYYGKPPGDAIHILNIAVNASQAQNTFFTPLRLRVERSPWFRGKFDAGRSGQIKFDKNVTAYSGHSQREAWEGYNLIFVVLDEIAAFKTAQESTGSSARADTAPEMYKMYKASITSRFPDVGKLCLLSFPRFAGDYITERFKKSALETEVVEYEETFKIDEHGPDHESNKVTVRWFEERVLTYKEANVMALRIPSWKFNPQRKMQEYAGQFATDMQDALSRFACNPPEAIDSFFSDGEKVREAFKENRHPFTDDWRFLPSFVGDKRKKYYMHVDLAQKSDRAAIALCHVEAWETAGTEPYKSIEPVVRVDAVRWWTPTSDRNVDFRDVKDYILAIRRRGFRLEKVTFDRWAGSIGLQNELAREGIEVETLSVGREEYNDFQLAIYDERLKGYDLPLLVDEILGLRLDDKGRVDHTASGSNDLADAVAGAVHLCMRYENRPVTKEIEIYDLDDVEHNTLSSYVKERKQPDPERPKVQNPKPVPDEVKRLLDSMQVI